MLADQQITLSRNTFFLTIVIAEGGGGDLEEGAIFSNFFLFGGGGGGVKTLSGRHSSLVQTCMMLPI